jgi:hypothetical protein
MSLWVQPLFGEMIEIPFSPPDPPLPEGWRPIYRHLHTTIPFLREKALHHLRLFHNHSADLSEVKDGDVLHLLVMDDMAERWVTEYTISDSPSSFPLLHHSTLSWFDGRWGDPHETPSIQYRTPLTAHVIMKEGTIAGGRMFMVNPIYFRERYPPPSPYIDPSWHPTLREALRKTQVIKRNGEEMTDNTVEHLVHLWELYHGTNQHLIDKGRYYE